MFHETNRIGAYGHTFELVLAKFEEEISADSKNFPNANALLPLPRRISNEDNDVLSICESLQSRHKDLIGTSHRVFIRYTCLGWGSVYNVGLSQIRITKEAQLYTGVVGMNSLPQAWVDELIPEAPTDATRAKNHYNEPFAETNLDGLKHAAFGQPSVITHE